MLDHPIVKFAKENGGDPKGNVRGSSFIPRTKIHLNSWWLGRATAIRVCWPASGLSSILSNLVRANTKDDRLDESVGEDPLAGERTRDFHFVHAIGPTVKYHHPTPLINIRQLIKLLTTVLVFKSWKLFTTTLHLHTAAPSIQYVFRCMCKMMQHFSP